LDVDLELEDAVRTGQGANRDDAQVAAQGGIEDDPFVGFLLGGRDGGGVAGKMRSASGEQE